MGDEDSCRESTETGFRSQSDENPVPVAGIRTDAGGAVSASAAGVIDFHALRHTFITNLARGHTARLWRPGRGPLLDPSPADRMQLALLLAARQDSS